MDVKIGPHLGINAIQKLAELCRTVSAMQFSNHPAAGHIERREQRGGAVSTVVVRAHRPAS